MTPSARVLLSLIFCLSLTTGNVVAWASPPPGNHGPSGDHGQGPANGHDGDHGGSNCSIRKSGRSCRAAGGGDACVGQVPRCGDACGRGGCPGSTTTTTSQGTTSTTAAGTTTTTQATTSTTAASTTTTTQATT